MGAIHKPRKFQFREIQNREIKEVAVFNIEIELKLIYKYSD